MKTFTSSLLIAILFGGIATASPFVARSPDEPTTSASPASTPSPSPFHFVCDFVCVAGTKHDPNVSVCNCAERYCTNFQTSDCEYGSIWAYDATSENCACIQPADACQIDVTCIDNYVYQWDPSNEVCRCY